MRKIALFTLLATFAFTLPASAARYHYTLNTGPAVSGETAAFPASIFYWESDTLVSPPACLTPPLDDDIDITKLPVFSGPTPTPTNLTVNGVLALCVQKAQPPPFLLIFLYFTPADLGTCVPPPFPYPYNFWINTPELPGFYSVQGNTQCGGDVINYNNSSLTIIDSWSAGPPPGPRCLHCRKRISLRFVEGPVLPLPGGPVEATLQLTTLSGQPASSVRRVTLTPGRISSVDFPPEDRHAAAGTLEDVVPVLNFVGAPAISPAVQITTESFDSRTDEPNGPLITSGISVPPSTLASQSLGHGETMRVIARPTSPNACNATLSFFDAAGNRVGPTASVNLPPGRAQTLDLTLDSLPTPASLRADRRIEILPVAQLTRSLPAASGPPVQPVCSVTAEVFNSATGVTATYQNAFLE
jgi:hypothetical protein